MERYHFDDLTKINCPFGLLDKDTQKRLKEWPHGVEWFNAIGEHSAWAWAQGQLEDIFQSITYRAKPAPLTKPHIPDEVWRVLPDWVTCAAQDSDGSVWALSADPSLMTVGTWGAGNHKHITWLKGVTPGTCHCRDSLVQRPEGL